MRYRAEAIVKDEILSKSTGTLEFFKLYRKGEDVKFDYRTDGFTEIYSQVVKFRKII